MKVEVNKSVIYSKYGNQVPVRKKVKYDESITVPNDADSIQDIIKKNARGIVDFKETPVAYFDQEIDSIDEFHHRGLDLTELDELQARTAQLSESIKAKQEALREAEIEAKAAEKLAREQAAKEASSKSDDD